MAHENLDDSPDLPSTAPVGEEEIEEAKTGPSWGKLIQLTKNGHSTRVLTDETYRVGRAPSCELPISERDMDVSKYILISKVHFKIERAFIEDKYVVYLEDLSSNGTFVNEQKIGKHKKIMLPTAAEISLASPNLKMYLYLDSSSDSINGHWLHSSMTSQFYILKTLGFGTFGDVRLVIDQQTCKKLAMKKILKERMSEKSILNEVNILKRLTHPCIVHLEGIFDTPDAVFITLEYVSGGNLLKKIVKLKKIPEFDCKVVFYQLLLGVEYLHNQGITHRDLKPDNILVEENPRSSDIIVKITDFGLSKISNSETHLKTVCGTMKYIAPEILAHCKTYDNKVDIWSLGVILFVCLSGQHPFTREDNTSQLARQIMDGKYKMSRSAWQSVSKSAIHLIKKILVVDPLKRISLHDLLTHQWLDDDDMRERITFIINEKSIEDLEPVLKKQRIM